MYKMILCLKQIETLEITTCDAHSLIVKNRYAGMS